MEASNASETSGEEREGSMKLDQAIELHIREHKDQRIPLLQKLKRRRRGKGKSAYNSYVTQTKNDAE